MSIGRLPLGTDTGHLVDAVNPALVLLGGTNLAKRAPLIMPASVASLTLWVGAVVSWVAGDAAEAWRLSDGMTALGCWCEVREPE